MKAEFEEQGIVIRRDLKKKTKKKKRRRPRILKGTGSAWVWRGDDGGCCMGKEKDWKCQEWVAPPEADSPSCVFSFIPSIIRPFSSRSISVFFSFFFSFLVISVIRPEVLAWTSWSPRNIPGTVQYKSLLIGVPLLFFFPLPRIVWTLSHLFHIFPGCFSSVRTRPPKVHYPPGMLIPPSNQFKIPCALLDSVIFYISGWD